MLTITSVYIYLQRDLPSVRLQNAALSKNDITAPTTLPCRDLPGANDTVMILKTGSTELKDKLPIHFQTTLRCYPNYLIFSDHAEQYHGENIIDALEEVNASIKAEHEDFALYRRLQRFGRASLGESELSGPASLPQDGKTGMLTNPGWKLDKWKFLPMIRRTLEEYPDKKWYVFVETDTYIFWSTLLAYLAVLEPSKPYYTGSQMQIGDVLFAHGGSGFAISRPTLEKAVAQYLEHKEEVENFTSNHWAGDCVLGKVIKDSGTSLTWAWPIWLGIDIGNMDYNLTDYGHRLWCSPAVSYHHLSPSIVEDLWRFEQEWIAREDTGSPAFLRHKDIYAEFILPRTSKPRRNWDNHADEARGPAASLQECRGICEEDKSCLQYSHSEDGTCLTTSRPNLGQASVGIQSEWLNERMSEFYAQAADCEGDGWIK